MNKSSIVGLVFMATTVALLQPSRADALYPDYALRIECDRASDQFRLEPLNPTEPRFKSQEVDFGLVKTEAPLTKGTSTFWRIASADNQHFSQSCILPTRRIDVQVGGGYVVIKEAVAGPINYLKISLYLPHFVYAATKTSWEYRVESRKVGEWQRCAGHGDQVPSTCLAFLPIGHSPRSLFGGLPPSFDCGEAAAPVELLICSRHNLALILGDLDQTMAVAFAAALAQARDKPALLAAQRRWLANRPDGCGLPDPPRVTPMWPWWQAERCVASKYEERIAELRQIAGDADPFAHLTVDFEGAVANDPDRNIRLENAVRQGDLLTLRLLLGASGELKQLGPALYWAAARGSLPAVRALVDAGASPSDPVVLPKGTGSVLRVAAELDRRPVVAFLLAHGARIDAVSTANMTAVILAAMTGDRSQVVQALASHTNLETRYGDKTALLVAVDRGFRDIASLLLEAGADPNATADDGRMPLHFAGFNGDAPMARLLIAHGADVNARTKGGPPLQQATDSEVARTLLSAGADVKEGTLLFDAAGRCDAALVRLLLQHGADPASQTYYGKTARQIWDDPKSYPTIDEPNLPPWQRHRCPPAAWPGP
jgi:ankyrin repeat protein/uncharacterized protein YecT (DUF1311 family)